MASINEDDWRQLLNEALAGLKGIGRAAVSKVLDEYAPRFAAATSAEELDDLRVNLEADGLVAGIKAEAAGRKLIQRVLVLALGVASKALI